MQTRTKLFLSLACLLAPLGSLWVICRDPGPYYAHHSLRHWVTIWGNPEDESHPAAAERDAAKVAIQHIGTNALPQLLEWITYEPRPPSKLKQLVTSISENVLGLKCIPAIPNRVNRDPEGVQAQRAVHAFEVLGPVAIAAVPQLAALANAPIEGAAQTRAVDALAGIGEPALPALLTVIANKNAGAQFYATTAVASFGSNALPAIPTLIYCLRDRSDYVAVAAAETLGHLKLEPHLVVPALSTMSQDERAELRTFAIMALGDFGESALPALPAVVRALDDDALGVRDAATNALLKIATESFTNAYTR